MSEDQKGEFKKLSLQSFDMQNRMCRKRCRPRSYDAPYFCVFDTVKMPCYRKLHSFPSLYDADCLENKTEIVDSAAKGDVH
ncbi:unnamed protein product [Caenorhabditis nigoni]